VCRSHIRDLLGANEIEYRGPAYVLGEDLPLDDRAREITAAEASQWTEIYPWLEIEFEAVAPVAIAFEAGQPAAICHSPRGVTALAAEAGVETIERFRGRGLATAAVACWARAIQRRGRLALYSTSWDNKASQEVARRLSARMYGEDWHVA
jgi:RimJ/RimL family protein N-acetyltransferase